MIPRGPVRRERNLYLKIMGSLIQLSEWLRKRYQLLGAFLVGLSLESGRANLIGPPVYSRMC